MKLVIFIWLLAPIPSKAYVPVPTYRLTYCIGRIRSVSDLSRNPVCCMHPLIPRRIRGAAELCCAKYRICTGGYGNAPAPAPAPKPLTTPTTTTPTTTTTLTTTTTTLTTTTTTVTTTTTMLLDHCNTTVKDELDIAEQPECCNNPDILEEYGGCCLEIFGGNEEACYVPPQPPSSGGSPPGPPQSAILNIHYCVSRVRNPRDVRRYPICCLHPVVRRRPGVLYECCRRFNLCFKKRKKRQSGSNLRLCDLNYCPRKFRGEKWIDQNEQCCLHPIRKFMKKRKRLYVYNEKCAEKGFPKLP